MTGVAPNPDRWSLAAGQGRDWIAARIPHAGGMCLLDHVVRAAPDQLWAATRSHLRRPHPLIVRGDRLGAAHGVEYASQAMALHGGLLAGAAGSVTGAHPGGGRLVSVRELRLAVPELARPGKAQAGDGPDPAAQVLGVHVTLEAGDARQASYAFALGPWTPAAADAGLGTSAGAWPGEPPGLDTIWVSGRASVLLVT
ncbi:hypothetical protein CCO03_10090 [Comamonas serinivorans]|uniref:Uncharacterized protein n=1 Tax=Comamonas serinivorans TaxID=1082851 RepID=A0A1Y0EN23_9BURK|nr:hypothetical protein [Comamonas serinivorans]ARU04986.1 hypothetical protein CCO03_10090 [Comamonas serinivorans]